MNALDLSPKEFRQLAERVLKIAADYLKDLPDRTIPAEGSGAEIEKIFHRELPEKGLSEEALAGWRRFVSEFDGFSDGSGGETLGQ